MISLLRKRPYLGFILPGLLLYSIFVMYPIFSAVQISLHKWNGIGPKEYVGLANYFELFQNDALFTQLTNALGNSLTIFLLNALVVLPIQLYMAYMIYNKVKGYRFFQAMIFSPQFISTPVIVFMGTLLLDGNIGVINRLFEAVGLDSLSRPWMGIPEFGIYVVWLMAAWAGIGIGMIFFVGAMKMIPQDMMEAAVLDGAGYWSRFFRIILPQIKTTILNLLILTYIFSMTVFDFSFILGDVSGGINGSVDVMALFFYRIAFGDSSSIGGTLNENAMGMGTTIACVMFLFILLVAMIQVWLTYRRTED